MERRSWGRDARNAGNPSRSGTANCQDRISFHKSSQSATSRASIQLSLAMFACLMVWLWLRHDIKRAFKLRKRAFKLRLLTQKIATRHSGRSLFSQGLPLGSKHDPLHPNWRSPAGALAPVLVVVIISCTSELIHSVSTISSPPNVSLRGTRNFIDRQVTSPDIRENPRAPARGFQGMDILRIAPQPHRHSADAAAVASGAGTNFGQFARPR